MMSMKVEAHLDCLDCGVSVFKLWRKPAEQEGGYEGVFLNKVTDMAGKQTEPGPCPDCGGALTRRPVDG